MFTKTNTTKSMSFTEAYDFISTSSMTNFDKLNDRVVAEPVEAIGLHLPYTNDIDC